MKKIIFSVWALVAFSAANAQDDSSITFGAKAGLNNSNLTDGKATTAFYVGGIVDFTVSDKFHVQPEVLYSVEGAKDASLSFIKVPILAKYYIADAFSLHAGPFLGFKVAAEDDFLDAATKSLDYGAAVGAAYDFDFGLFVDARYNLGLANLNEIDVPGAGDIKTTSIQVGVGYRF